MPVKVWQNQYKYLKKSTNNILIFMEDLAGEDNEEALFVENCRGKNTSDNNFRYKIYWYNNFSIFIATQNSLNIEPNNQKTHSNDEND